MREDDAARKDNKKRPYDSSSSFKVALAREAKYFGKVADIQQRLRQTDCKKY